MCNSEVYVEDRFCNMMDSLIKPEVFCYFIATVLVLVSDSLPINNEMNLNLCDINLQKDTLSSIKCSVGRNQALDYRTIRLFTGAERRQFSVAINCTNGGSVALPWPMKAENVVDLNVTGCIIESFLTEMTVQHNIGDQLRTLLLVDVSMHIPLRDLYKVSSNPSKITTDADCGQLTLESITFRNIHFELEISPEDRRERGSRMLHFGGHHEKLNSHPELCVFSNLKYLEETASRVSGQYHLKLIPDHAVFPKLEVYNVSNNNLDHVPRELRNLHSKKFPLLKKIDLSHNALSTFEFEVLEKPTKSCSVKTVNLQNNRISSLPLRTVKALKQIGTVFVDLRKNPLQCSCKLSALRKYLQLQYKNTSDINQRKLVSDITCTAPKTAARKQRNISILDPNFDKHCAT